VAQRKIFGFERFDVAQHFVFAVVAVKHGVAENVVAAQVRSGNAVVEVLVELHHIHLTTVGNGCKYAHNLSYIGYRSGFIN